MRHRVWHSGIFRVVVLIQLRSLFTSVLIVDYHSLSVCKQRLLRVFSSEKWFQSGRPEWKFRSGEWTDHSALCCFVRGLQLLGELINYAGHGYLDILSLLVVVVGAEFCCFFVIVEAVSLVLLLLCCFTTMQRNLYLILPLPYFKIQLTTRPYDTIGALMTIQYNSCIHDHTIQ